LNHRAAFPPIKKVNDEQQEARKCGDKILINRFALIERSKKDAIKREK